MANEKTISAEKHFTLEHGFYLRSGKRVNELRFASGTPLDTSLALLDNELVELRDFLNANVRDLAQIAEEKNHQP